MRRSSDGDEWEWKILRDHRGPFQPGGHGRCPACSVGYRTGVPKPGPC